MNFTKSTAKLQIDKILEKYQELFIFDFNDKFVHLQGSIVINRVINDFPLYKSYSIDIYVPLYSDELPYVIDTNKVIDSKYHHYYSNGKLCLETDSKIRIRFMNGLNLVEWLDEFVEPYFVYYEYYVKYGQFPNGERSHGIKGTIESYQDIMHAKDLNETYKIMSFIKISSYRGHHLCPCGSKKILRKCHGEWMLPFYKDRKIRKIIIDDLDLLEAFLNESRANKRKTK